MKKIFILFVFLSFSCFIFSQENSIENENTARNWKNLSFKDSVDGAIDLSDWIIYYNGFVPVPIIITEPAVGGFGLGLAPVFIKQNKPYQIGEKHYPAPPDIITGFGGYTANNSWAAGGGIAMSIPKYRLQYKIFSGYANVNMDFYFNNKQIETQKIGFNFETIPIFVSLGKVLKNPHFSIDLEYLFGNTKVQLNNSSEKLPDFISSKEMNSTISRTGLRFSFDSRDNVFTPDKGIKTYVDMLVSSEYIGSDYNYEQVEAAFYYYQPLTKRWINGLRIDFQQAFDDIPFYLKPMIDMRGIPAGRFIGKTSILAELEERVDVYKRWSLIIFGGIGSTFDDWTNISDASLAASYGGGFRYLLARKLHLRVGLDLGYSNINQFAWYIVFGSNWLRQ